jgi:fructose-bisphosphate aldolase class II
MHQNPSAFDPRKYLKEATKVMTEICVARYEACRTARDASRVQSLDLLKR